MFSIYTHYFPIIPRGYRSKHLPKYDLIVSFLLTNNLWVLRGAVSRVWVPYTKQYVAERHKRVKIAIERSQVRFPNNRLRIYKSIHCANIVIVSLRRRNTLRGMRPVVMGLRQIIGYWIKKRLEWYIIEATNQSVSDSTRNNKRFREFLASTERPSVREWKPWQRWGGQPGTNRGNYSGWVGV